MGTISNRHYIRYYCGGAYGEGLKGLIMGDFGIHPHTKKIQAVKVHTLTMNHPVVPIAYNANFLVVPPRAL